MKKGGKKMDREQKIKALQKEVKFRYGSILIQLIFAIFCVTRIRVGFDWSLAVIAAFEITLCVSDYNKIKRSKKALKDLGIK